MAQLLSISEYAEHRKKRGLGGCSRVAIYKAIKAGRIVVTSDGLIDPEQADKMWATRTQMRMPGISTKGY
ncbi:MAG: hypothetical protein KDD61_10160 [Bdellovibrionales bacterium]|nr:hypothetical protein [Bdellovibrionales bacterium]